MPTTGSRTEPPLDWVRIDLPTCPARPHDWTKSPSIRCQNECLSFPDSCRMVATQVALHTRGHEILGTIIFTLVIQMIRPQRHIVPRDLSLTPVARMRPGTDHAVEHDAMLSDSSGFVRQWMVGQRKDPIPAWCPPMHFGSSCTGARTELPATTITCPRRGHNRLAAIAALAGDTFPLPGPRSLSAIATSQRTVSRPTMSHSRGDGPEHRLTDLAYTSNHWSDSSLRSAQMSSLEAL
jgi:hypothetical protein